MYAIFSLSEWGDQRKVAVDFRKWFNDNARHRFNDNKWRSMYRTFKRYKGDVAMAIQHVPENLDSDTWAALCEQYAEHMLPDESGLVKKTCKFILNYFVLNFYWFFKFKFIVKESEM